MSTHARLSVLPPLPLGVWARRPRAVLPFPLAEPGCRLAAKARQGLFRALPALGLEPGDELLVPAYHHGSEVEAMVRAGLVPRFYDVGDDLAPEPDELESRRNARTRALYLTHYLGFPQDAPRWRTWCDQRDLLLVEDAAQTWLGSIDGRPVGSFGDLALFCLYKTFGLPDGAAVVTRAPAPPGHTSGLGLATLARRHGRWLATRSGAVADLGTRLRRPRRYAPEDDFALGDPDSLPAATTRALIGRVADPAAATARRRNHLALAERLGDLVPAALSDPPEGASPHAFAVETDEGPALVERLAAAGIRAFPFWTFSHPALPAAEFPGAAAWRSRLVVLPVHQELRPRDIDRIATAVRVHPPTSRYTSS